jgi:putative ubiquitin-RnfH superfamily antitoxin RatB of RatAB toxin-antitoxin module
MGPAEPAPTIRVEVVWVPVPHDVRRIPLTLPAGATARAALQASGLLAEFPGLADAAMGVWGRSCEGDQPLRDLDRVELYRPLTVDPKEARRLRHRRSPAPGGGAAARMKA